MIRQNVLWQPKNNTISYQSVQRMVNQYQITQQKGVHVQIAQTLEDLVQVGQLIYNQYTNKHIIENNTQNIYITPYLAHRTTKTFMALDESNRLVGTISLNRDSDIGLPIEQLQYPDQNCYPYQPYIHQLRLATHQSHERPHIAELTGFAIDKSLGAPNTELILLLSVYKLARYHDINYLVACVHPRHQYFHNRFLGSAPFTNHNRYPVNARGLPRIGLAVDVVQAMEQYKQLTHHDSAMYNTIVNIHPDELHQFSLTPIQQKQTIIPQHIPHNNREIWSANTI